MNANDVYKIACALNKEEQIKLCNMLSSKNEPKKLNFSNKKRKTISFSQEDAMKYLLKNHFKINN